MIVRWTVLAFSAVLLVVGIVPLVNPTPGATSVAPAYAIFHLIAAAVGLFCVAFNRGVWAPVFAVGFGLIDLYQAVASSLDWFPKEHFRWTSVDDNLHWALGLVLIVLGGVDWFFRRKRT